VVEVEAEFAQVPQSFAVSVGKESHLD
jgi:hypothetical protein